MKEIHKKIFLVLFVLCGLVAIDLVFGMFIIPRQFNKFRCAHYYYHHGLLSNREDISRWGGEEYRVYTNSLRMRDQTAREVSLIPTKRRILFIGDSFTEGIGVPYEDTFAGIIGNSIDAEILNSGVVGYSPKLYYLKTKYLIEKVGLKFHEAVILIDISDILNELEYEDYTPGSTDPEDRFLVKADDRLYKYSATYYMLSKLLKSPKELEHRRVLLGITPCWGTEHPEIYNARVEAAWTFDKAVYERFGKKGLALADGNMQKLIDLLKKNNITASIVVYPWPDQIYKRDRDSIQARHWREFSRKNGIRFLDLFPTFIDEKRYPNADEVYSRFFIQGDMHWNAAGHRVVADKILQFLEARK